jgi:hypothetical protein
MRTAFSWTSTRAGKTGTSPCPASHPASELRRPRVLPAAVERSIPPDVANGVAVWRSAAQGYVEALRAFADAFADEHGAKNPMTPAARVLARTATLVQAVNEDIASASEGPVIILKTHTLEKLLDFTLEAAAKSPGAARSWFKPFAKDVDAITVLHSGLMEVVRTGKVGIDTDAELRPGDSGTGQAPLDREASRCHCAPVKVHELESAATQLERQVQQAAKAARLGSGSLHHRPRP